MTDVWNTVANMRSIEASLYSLFQILECDLCDQHFGAFQGSSELATKPTPRGWCYYADYRCYRFNNPPQGRTGHPGLLGHLTVGVELWRELEDPNDAWLHAQEPLIYVGFAPKNDWWDERLALDYRGVPVTQYDGTISSPGDETQCLWVWNGEGVRDWRSISWFFALPLFSIASREDVLEEIIGPVGSLLTGSSPIDAFNGRRAIRRGGQQP